MKKEKVFKTADLRDLEQQVATGAISYGRMVEILNDMAYKKYSEVNKLNLIPVSKNEVALCAKKGCNEPVYEFGYCLKHYCISEETVS